MPTQIAPTPMIKGSEAIKIYKEANQEPSRNIEASVKALSDIFDGMIQENDTGMSSYIAVSSFILKTKDIVYFDTKEHLIKKRR